MHNKGLPAAAVVTASFEDLGYRMAEHNKIPGLGVIVLPYPLEDAPEDVVRAAARDAYPSLLKALGAA